jgi:hypothetical protein
MEINKDRSPSKAHLDIETEGSHFLGERTKELRCLYQAIEILGAAKQTSLDKTLQEVADLMPSGWQFPAIACAWIVVGKKEYRSKQFVPSNRSISADIIVNTKKMGIVEVIYTDWVENTRRCSADENRKGTLSA